MTSRPNSTAGIGILSAAINNTVGGSSAFQGNYISGNQQGIRIESTGTSNNDVLGNIIGLNINSTAAVQNYHGVAVQDEATNNHIGNSTTGNVISGNYIGTIIRDAGTSDNKVSNNTIGGPIPNVYGSIISNGATTNLIGEGTAATRNIFVNNDSVGVFILGATDNKVIGNYIGVESNGTSGSGNLIGIFLQDADNNRIGDFGADEGNLISGNTASGITLNAGSNGNLLMNNFIGTDLTGNATNAALPNPIGISLYGADGNFIGGDWNNNEGNVVCANSVSGIRLDSSDNNEIMGNNIGLSKDNDTYISNGTGVLLTNGADLNSIGSLTNGEENVITANGFAGIRVVI
jgi:hypothetical protein